jgi:chitin disaccharide deacetylase
LIVIRRSLIVNADDFGQTMGVTRGIVEAHERGIVTSTSLMVSWEASIAAAAYARTHPSLSAGLHVDLGEWVWRDGAWHTVYARVDPDDGDAVEREVRRQVECCSDLLGRRPTHVDSHQHVHRREPVRSIVTRVASELGVPLRQEASAIRYCGDFYGQGPTGGLCPELIAVSSLIALLRRLPEGITELGCHPGYAADLDSMYRDERAIELRTLCDAGVRQVVADEEIHLMSFGEVVDV